MKNCPMCDKDFPDSMRFCQTDGTLLVEKVADDPYKTIVGGQSDFAASIPPLDPMKTMVSNAPAKKADDDILQLPDEPDPMKTLVISADEMRGASNLSADDDSSLLDLPPAPSAPLIEPKPSNAAAPKFNETSLNAPVSNDLPPIADRSIAEPTEAFTFDALPENPPAPFDSKPFENDFSNQSPYGNQDNKPIPSPFDLSMPPGYQPPMNSFDASPIKDYAEPPPSSPFDAPPTAYGAAEQFNQPLQQAEWTPPPAPEANWQNQEIGANTPFQPPVAIAGQNQTLAIISLITGILSLLCCFSIVSGPAALVTGYLAKSKADQTPMQFGGRGMAIAGMITGGIGTLLGVLGLIYYLVVGVASIAR